MIGNGGREHALVWKIAQSDKADKVFVAPGNAGTATEPKSVNIAIGPGESEKLVEFASNNDVALTVVGPENPLADGIVDRFKDAGLLCFGPTQAAARLESSKEFSKEFFVRHNVPTAAYAAFSDAGKACDYIDAQTAPIVVKADGLAAGKGVTVAETLVDAKRAVRQSLEDRKFGSAGQRVLVEECLVGEEASFMCMIGGDQIIEMATSQDHKAAYDGDTGPNTGGMGAYSPAPVLDETNCRRVIDEIIRPTVEGLREEGIEYTGFLYAGLMVSPDSRISVLEYNCRMGDPETQPILLRLQSDLLEMCLECMSGNMSNDDVKWDSRAALGVVAAAGGYPGDITKGARISGLESADCDDIKVFHAGTTTDHENNVIVNGGRVLCVTALADGIAAAQSRAYDALNEISFEDMRFRTDIGHRALHH